MLISELFFEAERLMCAGVRLPAQTEGIGLSGMGIMTVPIHGVKKKSESKMEECKSCS